MRENYGTGVFAGMTNSVRVDIGGRTLTLTNLDKVYFSESRITKGELIKYYHEMAAFILPHLSRSPFVMVRYPDGIAEEYFYQKECPREAPEWVDRYRDLQTRPGPTYVVCNNLETLIYLVNLGCIEMHSWASTVGKPDYPEWGVFDLDPDPPSGFQEALQAARWIGEILQELGMKFLVKTSGSTGVHVLLPLHSRYCFREVQRGIEGICRFLVKQRGEQCTLERRTGQRGGKVYLDYLQNARGRTMAGIYSVRPSSSATVSTPLLWEEVVHGVAAEDFHLRNSLARVERLGDLSTIMGQKNDFTPIWHYFAN